MPPPVGGFSSNRIDWRVDHQILRANQAPPDPTQWLLTLGRLDRLLANENAPATTHDPAVWEKQSTHMPPPKKNIGDAQIHPGWILAEPPSLTTSPTALCHWIDVGAVMPVCLGPELLQAVLDPASSCVEPMGKMTKESDRAPGLWVGPGVVWQDQTLAGVCLVDPAQLRPTLGRCICVIRAPATALTQRTHFGVIATKLPTPITLQQVEKDACLWLDWAGIARSIDGVDHF